MIEKPAAPDPDPVMNVIEQEVSGVTNASVPSVESGRAAAFDPAAMGAVAARRRREFDAARSRLRDQAIPDAAAAPQPPAEPVVAEAVRQGGGADRMPLDQPPERVRKRYLRAGNQYFFKDAPYQLAFEDIGPCLVTEHNRADVVESMVDTAHAKSWQRVRVLGHELFRSEVWLQATLLGIEVSGYEPKPTDLARLADARQTRLNNRIGAAPESERTPAASNAADERYAGSLARAPTPQIETRTASDGGSTARTGRKDSSTLPIPLKIESVSQDESDVPRQYAGELCEHGRAPYQHNPARSDSYYVMFRDTVGNDRVVWGVDLERAVLESQATIGQQVTLENLGRRLVTIKAPILDGDGAMVGEEEKNVYRNTWQVDVAERGRLASRTRSQAQAPAQEVPSVAEPVSPRHRDARRAGDERVLHLAVVTAAMRAQGFSERSISRVQQQAARMLDAFKQEDIPVPFPKVFDAKAPSGRDRRMRARTDRAAGREFERAPAERSVPSR